MEETPHLPSFVGHPLPRERVPFLVRVGVIEAALSLGEKVASLASRVRGLIAGGVYTSLPLTFTEPCVLSRTLARSALLPVTSSFIVRCEEAET